MAPPFEEFHSMLTVIFFTQINYLIVLNDVIVISSTNESFVIFDFSCNIMNLHLRIIGYRMKSVKLIFNLSLTEYS